MLYFNVSNFKGPLTPILPGLEQYQPLAGPSGSQPGPFCKDGSLPREAQQKLKAVR